MRSEIVFTEAMWIALERVIAAGSPALSPTDRVHLERFIDWLEDATSEAEMHT